LIESLDMAQPTPELLARLRLTTPTAVAERERLDLYENRWPRPELGAEISRM